MYASDLAPGQAFSRRRFLLGTAGLAAAIGIGGQAVLAGNPPGGKSTLANLLAFIPSRLTGNAPPTPLAWTYSDVEAQLESLGIPLAFGVGGAFPDGYLNAIFPLEPGSPIVTFGRVEDLLAAIGFDPLLVHQSLRAGAAPEFVTTFRGGIDLDALPEAWAASGYEPIETDGGTTIWSIGRDGEFGFDHPVQRTMLANLNNVAISGDTLVYATHFALVEEALATEAAGGATDPGFGPAIDLLPGNTVSAIAVRPDLLLADSMREGTTIDAIETQFAASDRAVGEMPSLRGMIFGITAGLSVQPADSGEPTPVPPDRDAGEGLVQALLVAGSRSDARRAVEVVEHRWTTWNAAAWPVPYADLMELTATSVEGGVAILTFVPLGSPGTWREMVARKDLLPFMTGF